MSSFKVSRFSFTCAVAIFLGAFLLFQVQPVIGKMILPWFGGTPAVWTTCMLFFQVMLLGGYAYAALLARWKNPKGQAIVHLVLLVGALLFLPITPGSTWKPPDGQFPAVRILWMLSACVGVPYLLLSATSPLIQSWFAASYPGRSPYRLYALSNVGSLGALLLYPVIVEPTLSTSQQGLVWSGLFVLFVALSGTIAYLLSRSLSTVTNAIDSNNASSNTENTSPKSNKWLERSTWLILSAIASGMMLAITNHLCQDVAVIPFLWILPLSLYLISLIICFDRDAWYSPRWFSLGAIIAILIVCEMAFLNYSYPSRSSPSTPYLWNLLRDSLFFVIVLYLTLFFLLCMVCHGEVVRRRPGPSRLTEFYLIVSAGGALGGFAIAILCPLFFSAFYELNIGLVLAAVVCLYAFYQDAKVRWFVYLSPFLRRAVLPCMLIVIGSVCVSQWIATDQDSVLFQVRNFYGILSIRQFYAGTLEKQGQALYHGSIIHGYQNTLDSIRNEPTTYYGRKSGVGLAVQSIRSDRGARVGTVGLGIGTVAAYGEPGDTFRFYEINPLVIQIAAQSFSFLGESKATIEIIPGDARLSLEREPPQNLDLLVLDAFSGDSIPIHLLTREAFDIYLNHLRDDGIIAIHVSNRYVNLTPVVVALAESLNMHQLKVVHADGNSLEDSASDWMLMSRDRSVFDRPAFKGYKPAKVTNRSFPVWTDQRNNLIQILQRPE